MLTRSPVPARSTTASPSSFHGFHYAHVPSPKQSPSRLPAASSPSRHSSSSPSGGSVTSPSTAARARRYVSKDAATQYSPMERVHPATLSPLRPVPLSDSPHHGGPPPPPEPKPMIPHGEALQQAPPLAPNPIYPPRQEPTPSEPIAPPQPLSPNKRRASREPITEAGPSSIATPADVSALAKRPKQEAAPVKLLPKRYEQCSIEDMVVLIAHMLGELIETNDALALKAGHLTRFHSRTAPGISVVDYLHRLAKHATLTQALLLSMVYYIDRLCAMYPDFTINTLTVHRFLITAATVAAKGLSDSFWNNSTYARVGGIRVTELKVLESEFLYRVDWRIVPNPEVLVDYYRGLVERCPGYGLRTDDAEESEGSNESDEIDEDDEVDEDEDEELEDADGSSGSSARAPGQQQASAVAGASDG